MTEHICVICHAVTDEPILCASCSASPSNDLLETVGIIPEFTETCLVCGTAFYEWLEECPTCAERVLAPATDGSQ